MSQELEDDLAAGTMEVIPTVMQRLLMSLTPHDERMMSVLSQILCSVGTSNTCHI